ncbi:uncharacterized protein [Dermacentor albipictus]|uniref:uncharacterized protein n=1 Tax=Dermacentor albipictus TaxID=60249 RepID=UPI0031FC51A8
MVGGRVEVCSRLVQHGERASNAHQMRPSEFGLLLKARAAQQDIPAAPGKLCTLALTAVDKEGQAGLQAATFPTSRNRELAVCLQNPVAPNGRRQIRLERYWLSSKMYPSCHYPHVLPPAMLP